MDDVSEISIKPARNGWLLELKSDSGVELELYEHDIYDEIDMSPDNQEHKLPAMSDMLITIGRVLLQLNPESKETITVGIADRPEPILELSPEDEIEPQLSSEEEAAIENLGPVE